MERFTNSILQIKKLKEKEKIAQCPEAKKE
jgi:hypothetical protein